jgi:chaperonin GroES
VRITALRILGDRVLIRADEAQQTESGIYLPESAQKKPQRGTVLAVGEGRRLEDGSFLAPEVKVGDRVLYAKYGGTEVTVDGEDLLIMSTSQLHAIVPAGE